MILRIGLIKNSKLEPQKPDNQKGRSPEQEFINLRMELRRLELLTPAMPLQCSTN